MKVIIALTRLELKSLHELLTRFREMPADKNFFLPSKTDRQAIGRIATEVEYAVREQRP